MRSLSSRCCQAAVGIVVLLCVASCDTVDSRQQAVIDDVQATYTQFFKDNDFAYVVLTYPKSVDALPAGKQLEYRTLQRLLDGLAIPNENLRHDEAMVKFTGRKGDREYMGYVVREHLAARYAGQTVLFVNLGFGTTKKGVLHPICAKHKINVQVITDPISYASTS